MNQTIPLLVTDEMYEGFRRKANVLIAQNSIQYHQKRSVNYAVYFYAYMETRDKKKPNCFTRKTNTFPTYIFKHFLGKQTHAVGII